MSDRRRSPWIAWDSGFYGSTLCDGLAERFGAAGIVIWNAYLCACKRSLVPGQVSVYSDHDTLAQLGIQWLNLTDESGAPFTLDAVWTYLGRMKHVSRTRRGRATYITCTHWEAWQQNARSDMEAAKKRSKRAENATTLDADELPKTDTLTDTETLTDTNTDTTAEAPLAVVKELPLIAYGFDGFWDRWPEEARQSRPDSQRAFNAARGAGTPEVVILQGLDRWVEHWRANSIEPQFIGNPANWLKNQKWNDPTPVARKRLSRGEQRNEELRESIQEFTAEDAR